MKKVKILSLILACCLLIAGCGIDKNLKMTKIGTSASSYYHMAMKNFEFVLNEGQVAVNETLASSYGSFSDSLVYLENYYYSIISMADYCGKITSGTVNTSQIIPPYEYVLGDKDEKIIVFIENKDTTKNNKYSSKLYYVYGGVTSYENLLEEQALLSRTFVFTAQKDGSYTFKEDTTNGMNGAFVFNKENGYLSISFSYTEESLTATTVYTASTQLYNYESNVVGGRMYLNISSGGKNETIIGEFLFKDFYKKLKIGTVKDSKLYINMEKTEEEFVATHNDGDQFVFDVVYDNTIDSKPPQTSVIGWGKQK